MKNVDPERRQSSLSCCQVAPHSLLSITATWKRTGHTKKIIKKQSEYLQITMTKVHMYVDCKTHPRCDNPDQDSM